jgi:hypothetical protein
MCLEPNVHLGKMVITLKINLSEVCGLRCFAVLLLLGVVDRSNFSAQNQHLMEDELCRNS